MDLPLHTVKEDVEGKPEEEEEQPYTPSTTPRPRPTQILQRPSSRSVLSAETPEFRPRRPNLQLVIPSSTPTLFTGSPPHSTMPVIQETPPQRSSGMTFVAGSQGSAPPQQPQSVPEPFTISQPHPSMPPTEESSSRQSASTTPWADPGDRSPSRQSKTEESSQQQSASTTPGVDHRGRTPPRQPRAFQVSHTNSNTWLDNRLVEREKWKEIERNFIRLRFIDNFNPAIVPHNFNEYMVFRRDRAEGLANREARRLAQRNPPNVWPLSGLAPVKIGPAFGGKCFNDGRSAVLAQRTIWSRQYVPSVDKPQAPWPTIEEMREEGDERATSKFGRFPGLPRMPGNETAGWRARVQLQQHPMDEVWRRPSKETYEAARSEVTPEEMEDMEALLGKGLVDALNCKTSDDF